MNLNRLTEHICNHCGNNFKTRKQLYSHSYNIKNKEGKAKYQKKYDLKNKEKLKEYHRKKASEYHYNNRKKRLEAMLKWSINNKEHLKNYSLKNKEKHNKYSKNYIQEHKEECKEYDKKYYQKNRIKRLEYIRKYQKTPKGIMIRKAMFNNRRKVSGCSNINFKLIKQIYEENIKKHGILTCELCFKPIIEGQEDLEHFIPLSRYKEFPGKDLNALDNLGLAHGANSKEKCNNHKLNKTLNEWFQSFIGIKNELK